MADKGEPKEEQTPKGLEVPVPKRRDFFRNLRKVLKPSAPRRPEK